MLIPRDPYRRDQKLLRVLEDCTRSQKDRCTLYERRRRYFLFGSYKILQPGQDASTRYNRLQSHTDLVASFLYAADHAKYSVSAPRNSEDSYVKKVMAAEDRWNDTFINSGLANRVGEAVEWATIYDCMTMKLGWNDARKELTHTLVEPHSFGVYNESEPDIDSQEAFCHTYALDFDNAVLRLLRAGLKAKIPRLGTISGPKISDYPPILSNLIISATGGANLSGPILGQASPDYNIRASYEPMGDIQMFRFHELWVWDDMADDYAVFTIAEPDIVISDSRETIEAMRKATRADVPQWESSTNIFLPGEHPFVPIRPYPIYNFYWGESFVERVIPIQDWSNERLDQIAAILEKQVDPAKVFSGFMGLSDEKAGALGGPGSWVVDQLPNAKVEELAPKMPEDLFREFNEIGAIFLEAAGLTETVSGKGEQGVRGKGHAKQLAATGSSRIRKAAVGLEDPLSKLGGLGLKLMQKNDATPVTDDDGQEMLLADIDDNWSIRIAAHSHSPLFSDEVRELADKFLATQTIDKEDFIRMMNPPNANNLIHKVKAREKAKAQLIAQHPELAAEGSKGAHHKGAEA